MSYLKYVYALRDRITERTGHCDSFIYFYFSLQSFLQFIVCTARCKTINERDPAGIFSALKSLKVSLNSIPIQPFPMLITLMSSLKIWRHY